MKKSTEKKNNNNKKSKIYLGKDRNAVTVEVQKHFHNDYHFFPQNAHWYYLTEAGKKLLNLTDVSRTRRFIEK